MTSHSAPGLCGLAKDKAELFRERYTILQQVRGFLVFIDRADGGATVGVACCIYTDTSCCSGSIGTSSSPHLQ